MKLSPSERAAIKLLFEKGGFIRVRDVPDKNEKDEFNDIIPGISAYQKLDKKELVLIVEEEYDETLDIVFGGCIELTDLAYRLKSQLL